MMDILKLLCEEGDPVCVVHAQDEIGGSPEVEMTSIDSPPSDTDIQSPCDVYFMENPSQDRLSESHTDASRKSRLRKRRRRRLRADRLAGGEHPPNNVITTSEEKQRTVVQRAEGRIKEAGKLELEKQAPKLDVAEISQPGDIVDEEVEEEERDMNEAVVTQSEDKSAGQQGADEERVVQRADGEVEVHAPAPAPAAGSATKSRVYPEGLAPVIIKTSTKKILKCPKCDKTFDRAGKYESHTRVHTGEKPFQCDICLQRYSTKSNLTVHKKKHASDAPFQKKEHKCPFCNKLHASKKTLAKHNIQEFLTKRKRKSEVWKCAICLKTFTRKPHLQEHMILHTQDRPFKCSFCDEYFRSRFARLKHQEKFHLGPFPCEICGRQFNDTGNRKRHIECTHGGKRKWTCFVCGKSVRERTTLREHLRIHSGEKPHLCSEKAHQCEECGKCFRRHDHLTVHYKSIHLGEKVWQKYVILQITFTLVLFLGVDVTFLIFFFLVSVALNVIFVHRYKTAVHQCEVCKKEFKGKSSLEMHFRTHSGEKPHRCPECNQTFRIKKTLTKHMVIHSDARPFNCPQCSATFKRKDKLKYHVDHVHSVRFSEQPLGTDKMISLPFEEPSKGYHAEPKPVLQSPPPPANVCVPVTLVPVRMAGGAQDPTTLSSQTHSVVSMQGQQQNSSYQAATDLAFLEKYTLTPQPANVVRADQMLDPREQSYLGTLLGLDSASSVQNISNSDHSH
ncbi:hypothetical protein F7725_011915 [Dissostichus mawsoni]|uniref:C2H2-type domain-containing protein n=1 Tax=Dissostichus mawsoni TaxID=36200 RepID=A0A7J5ZA73_DISMA|nr:hypothetical protein F7725_011915 [Dissostichus mawsoni]